MTIRTLEIVHTCGERLMRVDLVHYDDELWDKQSPQISTTTRAHVTHAQRWEKPDGSHGKIRWTCPAGTCAIDVQLGQIRLTEVVRRLAESDIPNPIELAYLSSIL